ncbi:MAG: hypothetical protein AAF488_01705, partial [Planctomycetota bacterium]
ASRIHADELHAAPSSPIRASRILPVPASADNDSAPGSDEVRRFGVPPDLAIRPGIPKGGIERGTETDET